MPDPVVGIIFERDKHPAAKRLEDLLNLDSASQVLCDEHIALSDALLRNWDNDAHFILYSVHDEDDSPVYARVSKRSPFVAELLRKGGQIRVHMLVLDHDLPNKAEWAGDEIARFANELAELDLPDPTFWYSTLHGSRFIYQLAQPVDHLQAEALSRALIARFAKQGIALDSACADWTRLFRLPRTVRSDTGQLFDPKMLNGGPLFDPTSIEVVADATAEVFADIKPYDGEIPDADQVHVLLGNVSRPTDWVKIAKKYLTGREAYPICFEEKLIDPAAGRNNQLVKLAGQIVGMTAREEAASPEGVYALLFSAVEQLNVSDTEGTDWHKVAWDVVCRMWANESAQIEAELRLREGQIVAAKAVRLDLIDKLKAARPGDVPTDPKDAEAFFRQRMIASDGKVHWVMRPDGSYNIKPVGDSMLVPMIKELGMVDVIGTSEMRGKSWVTKSAKSILDDHATPIISLRCSAREPVAFIEGPPGHRMLHLPVHRINPVTRPLFCTKVDEWLRSFFDDKYDLGIEWLSWCLEVGAPICALNLYGAPGAGKGLLMQGLAECFEGERTNDGRVLGKFNEGLLHTPIINCDEGVPLIRSDESLPLDQAFRSFVSGGSITIRSMFMNPFTANIYPRIVFTSNDRDILRLIVGNRDLTDDDIRAIEIRLLSINVKATARDLLTAKGNYTYTSGWVHGKFRSNYILANHIRFLHEHRRPSRHGTGRLLVEGEVATRLVSALRLRSAGGQLVLRSLAKMLETPTTRHGLYFDEVQGRVWITPACVVHFAEGAFPNERTSLTMPRAGQVLRQFSARNIEGSVPLHRPPGAPQRGRWIELDLGLLYEETERYGMANVRIEALLKMQPDGAKKVQYARLGIEDENRD